MKKKYWIRIIIAVIVLAIIILILRSPEDFWIKGKNGEYVEHGAPASTLDYVKSQQDVVSCARQLYQNEKAKGMVFISQCLGTCGDYAIDIVNVPKTREDDLKENQCEDYMQGKVTGFIELDREGNIFRIS